MKTMIISAFPGCGKTYLYDNQDFIKFDIDGKPTSLSFTDLDSSKYDKHDGWEKEYVEDIKKAIGTVSFIFISQHDLVLSEMDRQLIPFMVIYPNNTENIPYYKREIIKQQWFGRFILRDNSHISDFNAWLEKMKEHYDEWTSLEQVKKHHPDFYILLNEDQYISDYIPKLYKLKEAMN